MTHFMNYEPARDKMRAHQLDALLVSSPEGFYYATGFSCMLLDLFRQAPLGLFLLPSDEGEEPAVILPETDMAAFAVHAHLYDVHGFPVWWEAYPPITPGEKPFDFMHFMSSKARPLPPQHEPDEIFRILSRVLQKRGLSAKRIGVELEFMSARMLAILQASCPDAHIIDCTSLMYTLRQVKAPEEISHLYEACRVTEGGLLASAKTIHEGAALGDLNLEFRLGVLKACQDLGLSAGLGEIGGQPALGFAGANSGGEATVRAGTTVKYDMQVSVNRYYSDIGRTYLFGAPSREQEVVYRALLETHDRMREVLRPGIPICKVYETARASLDRHGLWRHARGHFGHSVGLDRRIEEPPFICASETGSLEKGMVLAVETPFYFDGVGKFQVEDMLVIGESGPESMTTLSKDWKI